MKTAKTILTTIIIILILAAAIVPYRAEEPETPDIMLNGQIRVDVLYKTLEEAHGEELAQTIIDIIRTHPDKDSFPLLWDEDLIDLGIDPIS